MVSFPNSLPKIVRKSSLTNFSPISGYVCSQYLETQFSLIPLDIRKHSFYTVYTKIEQLFCFLFKIRKELPAMASAHRIYIAIDLKSYYASQEAVHRGLDPLTTNLVVADSSRTEKTICLAVSPSLKAYGIPGRPRLFEVVQKVREINARRLSNAIRLHKAVLSSDGSWTFAGKSTDARVLARDPSLALDYIIAPPHMAQYLECSARIYGIYLKYIAPEDIHVYSIDEVFMDVTGYLTAYRMTPRELAVTMIKDVLKQTGITATAGIGTNLYLAKVAMDIVAKRVPADRDGVRIAELNEYTYRKLLWAHEPLTDFWRIGRGYARKLQASGLVTMGDIARCSIGRDTDYYNEDFLYRLFGINAELLIDHAWGWEPCTLAEVKDYKPHDNSLGSGQVLTQPYDAEKARLVVQAMTDLLVLDLVDKQLVTNQLVLTIGYDISNLSGERAKNYHGPITTDHYGRLVPKHAHGTKNLDRYSSSTRLIMDHMLKLYDRIIDKNLLIRRVSISANHIIPEADIPAREDIYEQLNLFTDYASIEKQRRKEEEELERERNLQLATLSIKTKYGKNAILKGMNFQEGATTRDRNCQIGGHKA